MSLASTQSRSGLGSVQASGVAAAQYGPVATHAGGLAPSIVPSPGLSAAAVSSSALLPSPVRGSVGGSGSQSQQSGSASSVAAVTRMPPVSRDFLAGGIAGAVSRSAVAPLERLKIMYMCAGEDFRRLSVGQALSKLWKDEGMAGFFRGNGANVVRIFPFSAIQLSAYPVFKSLVTQNDKTPITPGGRFWCGVMSGVSATFATYPLDFIRCRLSMQSTSQLVYKGVVDGIVQVARKEGFLRLYTGLAPTLVGIVPYAGIQLSVYDLTKDFLLSVRGTTKPDQLDFFVSGAWAGMMAQTAAFPIELVRRRMQVRGFDVKDVDSVASHTPQKVTFIDEFRNIIKQSGFRGLYRGLWPNYLKIVPSQGVSFLVFEQSKVLLDSLYVSLKS